jgi:hypothetical protein
MSANQRKNKNKKKKTPEHDTHSTGSATIQHVDQPTVFLQHLEVDVLFQGRKGSATNSNKIYISAGDIKSLGLQPGAFVHVQINPNSTTTHSNIPMTPATTDTDTDSTTDDDKDIGVTAINDLNRREMICQAWPSTDLMKNTASLTRFWQPNFPDDKRRDVVISKTVHHFTVHDCTAATFSIRPNNHLLFNHDEVTASSAFRRYFAAALCEATLCINNSFILSWRGELIYIQVTS